MKAPDFSLKNIQNGEFVKLESYKGKPVMLTFWASWCPDSVKDLAQKNHFYESMKSEQLVFLTVNVTGREGNKEDGHAFLAKQGYRFPALADEGTKTYDKYRCMGVPTTVLINEEQEIVQMYNDKVSFLTIMEGVTSILKK
ncbi:TlpA disulfide reductase family protein [Bacillus sp. FJAT-44742]|uniref:TlpA disulfide reductase family protein n=1 Tax=Bacillus sp. FJAT-44742 TaxID=2014005 RepID=UPI000C24E007|nr:TlpA disulfide reductase family protein [Bacillus sp. FJAT-44742]